MYCLMVAPITIGYASTSDEFKPDAALQHNQIVGSVRITRDNNSELRDQTNREGIVESQAFDDLRACVKEALSKLETWRFQHRRKPDKQDMGEGLFHELDIEPIKTSFQERHPEDKEFVKYLDDRARKVKKLSRRDSECSCSVPSTCHARSTH